MPRWGARRPSRAHRIPHGQDAFEILKDMNLGYDDKLYILAFDGRIHELVAAARAGSPRPGR